MEDIKEYLTKEEIEFEIQKIGNFFDQVSPRTKSCVAERLIFEIVNQASYNHYEALGIFQEAMINYRETALSVEVEMAEEKEFLKNLKQVKCVKIPELKEASFSLGQAYPVEKVEENSGYSGGLKFLLIDEEGKEIDFCKNSLQEHFEPIEDEDD